MEQLLEYYMDPKRKPALMTLDVGMINMASNFNHTVDDYFVGEHSSILQTKDGRVYKEYVQGNVAEMVYTWMSDRWNDYFNKSRLILVEQQLTFMKSNKDKACLLIQTCIEAYLRMKIPEGGPLYLVVASGSWKQKAGIEVGNNPTPNLPGRVVNGVFQLPEYNRDHGLHKKRSLARYRELLEMKDPDALKFEEAYPEPDPRDLFSVTPKKTVDMIEAFLMMWVLKRREKEFMMEALKMTNHSFSIHDNRKRVSTLSRMIELKPFGVPLDLDYVKAPAKKRQRKLGKKGDDEKELIVIE